MTVNFFLSLGFAAALAASGLASSASAQVGSGDNDPGDLHERLKMVVDYGQGRKKQRRSHQGVMEMVGVPTGQVVLITLEFPKRRAGLPVVVKAMDGGQVTAEGPLVVGQDGTVAFAFQSSSATGLQRLMVLAAEEHEIQFCAFDSNAPAKRRPTSAGP